MHQARSGSGQTLLQQLRLGAPIHQQDGRALQTPTKQPGWGRRVLCMSGPLNTLLKSELWTVNRVGKRGGKRPLGNKNFAPRTCHFFQSKKRWGGKTGCVEVAQDAFLSINAWLKCITRCQRPPEKHVTWTSSRRQTCGRGWWCRNHSGLWAGEKKRPNTLGKDHTSWQRSPGTTGNSSWDRLVQFQVLTRGLCQQQHLPDGGSCCSVPTHPTHCFLMQLGFFPPPCLKHL